MITTVLLRNILNVITGNSKTVITASAGMIIISERIMETVKTEI